MDDLKQLWECHVVKSTLSIGIGIEVRIGVLASIGIGFGIENPRFPSIGIGIGS